MKTNATSSQARASSTPRRAVVPRTLLLVGGVTVVGALVALFECGALRQAEKPTPEPEVASQREVAGQRVPSPTTRTAPVRPSLPQMPAGAAAEVERPSSRAVNKLVRTQMKVQKYVEEAYPAWRQAHPGQECPHELIELNEYMGDIGGQDTKDGWGRRMRMFCGVTLKSGAKGFKVVSYGRDAEPSEDDIKFEQ